MPSLERAGLAAAISLIFTSGALDPRLSFSRASNATQFDAQGRLVWAPANLIQGSSTSGAVVGVIGSGGALPNGWSRVTASGISHEVVAVTDSYIDIRISGTNPTGGFIYPHLRFIPSGLPIAGVPGARYTLAVDIQVIAGSTNNFGSVGNASINWWSGVSYVSQSVGAGNADTNFRRVATTGAMPSSGANNVAPQIDIVVAANATVDITMRVGRPQLEFSDPASPKAYIETAGSQYYGPRFDYDPATSVSLGLLLEETRTNLAKNSYATPGGITVANVTADNSVLNTRGFGYPVVSTANGVSGQHYCYGNSTQGVAASTIYTLSAIVISSTNDLIQITPSSTWADAANIYVNFQFSTGTIVGQGSGVTATSVQPLGGGAFRVSFTFSSIAAPTDGAACIFGHISAAADIRLPTTTLTNTIVAGCAQLEAGSFPTSYIPTFGSTATRAADTLGSLTVPNGILTMYVEGVVLQRTTTLYPALIELGDGTGFNRNLIFAAIGSSAHAVTYRCDVAGVQVATAGTSAVLPFGSIFKAALSAGPSSQPFAVNGAAVTPGSGSIPSSYNLLSIGRSAAQANTINARWIRKVMLFAGALPAAKLQEITA